MDMHVENNALNGWIWGENEKNVEFENYSKVRNMKNQTDEQK